LQTNLNNFADNQIPLPQIAAYYVVQLPQFLMICIPVSLLLSVLFSLSKMSRSNELIAMLASGRSLGRVLLPLLGVGLLLSGFCAVLNYKLAPYASQARVQIKKSGETMLVAQLFPNRTDRRMWYVTEMPANTSSPEPLRGVQIHQEDDKGMIRTIWYAATASYDAQNEMWTLSDGKYVQLTPDGTIELDRPFQNFRLLTWNETPWRIASANVDPQGLSVPELSDYLRWNADFTAELLAPYRTHWHYRWAQAVQCFFIVLFAAPLAVVFSRRGAFSGIAGAIFLFAGMYLLSLIGVAIAGSGRIMPWLGAWGPGLLFGLVGLVLLHMRANNREMPKLGSLFSKR